MSLFCMARFVLLYCPFVSSSNHNVCSECGGRPHLDPGQLANEFDDFFVREIKLIEDDIDNIHVQSPDVECRPPVDKLVKFSMLSEEEVRKIINGSSKASCRVRPNSNHVHLF